MKLSAWIDGIGLIGPGLPDWPHAADILAGHAAYHPKRTEAPPPAALPSAERRRSGPGVRVALDAASEAVAASGWQADALPAVFAASGPDGYNYHAICETLAGEDRSLSPTRFHNSVHNAAAGYWSIACGAMTASNVLTAHDASFGAGLLDAMSLLACDGGACLLVAYDTDYPEPLRTHRPIPDCFGLGLVLAASAGPHTLARLDLAWSAEAATTLAEPALEMLRSGVPSARALPLLRVLAGGSGGSVVLDYLDELRLRATVTPHGADGAG
ncbi:beta-ketoacyl synthase chain length factor [Cupriavidus malaysiensis]|uniref:3-oxoacyl-ACP synthase n=1 Tax=Cupriavidus malaysiensis TaxID=367825 RepID=A0ABN4TQD2_9BURK|nr:beta-ketoacyl synthase chain length factor [Cupriavidus malaysiensis]AOZ09537.1 3-oxoacyl-ACP synthase [Cupriavidus malaysiensis]